MTLKPKWTSGLVGEYERSLKQLKTPEQPPQRSFDYKEHAEGLQRDYDLLLAEYNDLKAQHKPEQEKTVCPFCSSEWVTAEQHDRKVDRLERLPLTDEEALKLWNKHEKHWRFENNVLAFTRAIEAAHGIKGEA